MSKLENLTGLKFEGSISYMGAKKDRVHPFGLWILYHNPRSELVIGKTRDIIGEFSIFGSLEGEHLSFAQYRRFETFYFHTFTDQDRIIDSTRSNFEGCFYRTRKKSLAGNWKLKLVEQYH